MVDKEKSWMFFLGEERLRQFECFTYLGVEINQENEQMKEIKNRNTTKTCSCCIPY